MTTTTWLQFGEDAEIAHAFANTLLEAGFAEIEARGFCGRYPTAELRTKSAGSKYCSRCVRAVGFGGEPNAAVVVRPADPLLGRRCGASQAWLAYPNLRLAIAICEVNAMSMPFTVAPASAVRINIPEVRRFRRRWGLHRRRPGQWIAPCRDEANRRRQLLVVVTDDGRVAVVVPPGNVAVLDLLMVGRLRAALRDAVFVLDDLDAEKPRAYSVSIESAP